MGTLAEARPITARRRGRPRGGRLELGDEGFRHGAGRAGRREDVALALVASALLEHARGGGQVLRRAEISGDAAQTLDEVPYLVPHRRRPARVSCRMSASSPWREAPGIPIRPVRVAPLPVDPPLTSPSTYTNSAVRFLVRGRLLPSMPRELAALGQRSRKPTDHETLDSKMSRLLRKLSM